MAQQSELEQELSWATSCRSVLRTFVKSIAGLESPASILSALTETIGRALAVDRALIYDLDLDRQLVVGMSEWLNPDAQGIAPTVATYPLSVFRGGAELLWRTRGPVVSHADAPEPALLADGSAALLHGAMGIKSGLWFPFAFRERGFHALIFNQVTRQRTWTEREIEFTADATLQVEVAIQKFRMLAERSEALAAADRTNARLEALISNSPSGVLFESLDRRVQVVNRAFCSLFDIDAEPEHLAGGDCAGSARAASVLFADPTGFVSRVEACVANGVEQLADELLLADGRVYERDYVPLPGGPAEGGHLWVYRDVTLQRLGQARLRQLERAIEQSPVSVLITDPEGRIVYVNRRFSQITGYAIDEVIGRNPRFLKSAETPPEVHRELWQWIGSGREWTGELVDLDRSGAPFDVRLSVSPVHDERGRVTHYVAIQEDLRDQRRAAAALGEANNRLALAQKMEAVAQLAGGVAHDFNNLLTVIISCVDIARASVTHDPEVTTDLTQAIEAARRAAGVTRRLLAFSRRDAPDARSVEVDDFLRALERVLTPLLGEDVSLSIELGAGDARAWVEPAQLEQAILNLASNARDAMPDGGSFALRSSIVVLAQDGRRPQRAPSELSAGEYLVVRAADTGVGMDEAHRARAFEPFFTTKERGRGTGLGLSQVYAFAKQSGGAVTLTSAPAKGTELSIWLPVQTSASADHSSARLSSEAERDHADGARPREGAPVRLDDTQSAEGEEVVLVVEDDAEVRELERRSLARAGYRVFAAANGGEALLWCERNGASLQLLVCDVIMPTIRGPALIDRLRPLCPNAGVLFVTGYADASVIELPMDADVLRKPFTPQQLCARVRACLDRAAGRG